MCPRRPETRESVVGSLLYAHEGSGDRAIGMVRIAWCVPERSVVIGEGIPGRWLMMLFAIFGPGGCAEDKATKITKDPYLPTMMKDPLFTWMPKGDIARTQTLLPRNNSQMASGSSVSRIVVELTFRTSGDAAELLRQAEEISANAGYINNYRQDSTGLGIHRTMGILKGYKGIQIVFLAPS
jgi:hypothetical protein